MDSSSSFGYALFILTESGEFNLKTIINRENPDRDDIDDGDIIIAKLPLTEKSLTAIRAVDKIWELESITGNGSSANSLFEMIYWLIERSSKASFAIGRGVGRNEQAALQQEIERLASGKF